MGYMQYHAIVVTDHGYGTTLDEAHKIATEIFRWISPISPGMTNGVRAFFMMIIYLTSSFPLAMLFLR